jgi:predicted nucleotidyltransferase component of viral defense system
MKLPIVKQLKKRDRIETAGLQDELIHLLYNVDNSLIIHGGTAIWRCYSGYRFSVDIDLYSVNFPERLTNFKKELKSNELKLNKLIDTGNIVFLNISSNDISVKIEINHKYYPENHVEMEYELIDGNTLNVLTLSAESLINEKILAYKDRKFIRDLYDIYVLLKYVDRPETVKSELLKFINTLEKPVDENVLKTIVYSGLPPSYNKMVDYINQFINSI